MLIKFSSTHTAGKIGRKFTKTCRISKTNTLKTAPQIPALFSLIAFAD